MSNIRRNNDKSLMTFKEFIQDLSIGKQNLASTNSFKVQQLYHEYLNREKRKRLIERLAVSENNHTSDVARYDDIKKLFSINYFRTDVLDLSIEEQVQREKNEKKLKEKDSLISSYDRNKIENMRSREAYLFFQHQKAIFNNSGNLVNKDFLDPIKDALNRSSVPDPELIASKLYRKIDKDMSYISLHNEHTFIPDIEIAMQSKQKNQKKVMKDFRLRVLNELNYEKNNRFVNSEVNPTLAPISIKDKLHIMTIEKKMGR
eukprot:gene13493-18104_t